MYKANTIVNNHNRGNDFLKLFFNVFQLYVSIVAGRYCCYVVSVLRCLSVFMLHMGYGNGITYICIYDKFRTFLR